MSIKDDKDDRKMLAVILLWAVIATIVFVYLASCCPCRNVVAPPPEVHYVHDTVKTKEVRDSIVYKDKIVKDSSSFTQKGDTIRIERWHWERDYSYEKILEARLDSFSNAEKDSIPYPVYIDKEVPAEIKWWQKSLMWTGVVCILLAILYIMIKLKFPYRS